MSGEETPPANEISEEFIGTVKEKLKTRLKDFKETRKENNLKDWKKLRSFHRAESQKLLQELNKIDLPGIEGCGTVLPKQKIRGEHYAKITTHNGHTWHPSVQYPLVRENQPIPTYSNYLTLRERVQVSDEKHLRFIPYLGEGNQLELDMALYDDQAEKADSDFSETDEVRVSVVNDFPEEQKEEVWEALENILSVRQEKLQARVPGNAPLIAAASLKQKEMLETKGHDTDVSTALETFETLWCGQCRKYDCPLHGGFKHRHRPLPQPTELKDDPDPYGYILDGRETSPELTPNTLPSATFSQIFLSKEMKEGIQTFSDLSKDEEKKCGEFCYRHNRKRTVSECEWNDIELSQFRRLLAVTGKNPCWISTCLGTKSCEQVWDIIEVVTKSYEENLLPAKRKEVEDIIAERKRKRPKKSQKKNVRMNESEILAQYEPCYHPGKPCKKPYCKCAVKGIHCEIYCGCSSDCALQWRGCRCGTGRCRTKACPCYAAMRECNPDLCTSCQAYLPAPIHNRAIAHSNAGEESAEIANVSVNLNKLCCNLGLTHRRGKQIVLCKSKIHGFGAVTTQAIHKHEYITEYMGELISQDEADRRGKLYDQQNLSYLFNLNQEVVIDATRKGNKMKFVNHSGKPNSYVRVMNVNGNHHVALFANQKIKKGEELAFDYKHETLAQIPTWQGAKNAARGGRHG